MKRRIIILLLLLLIITTSISLWADFSRDDSTQIVTDNSTGLEWQDDTHASSITLSFQLAIEHCETLNLDGGGWRLPNFNELYYIADRSTKNPAMNSIFINFSTSYYWSATTYADNADYAWVVYFYYGIDNFNRKNYSYYVRCVRDGQ
ncbi:MAG: DUF1566 domain-containing protein [Sulfurovum sp.]|nr:DUF1566 domain-containing protein [Sulfurovum sp.]